MKPILNQSLEHKTSCHFFIYTSISSATAPHHFFIYTPSGLHSSSFRGAMAEAIVGAIMEKLVGLAADAIEGQLRAAWGLEDNLEKLKRLLLRIHSMLADAEEKQTVRPDIKSWLNALKKVAYEADDVLDELNYETLRHKAAEVASDNKTPCSGKVCDFFSCHNPLLIRLRMGRKLSNLLEAIDRIADEGTKFNFNYVETAAPVIEDTYSFVEESEVVGRLGEKDELVNLLINNVNHNTENIAVLPIVGMGGLGKTTLAQLIYKDQRVVDRFELRAWVCVSDPWDAKKIIQEILNLAGKKCESDSMEELHLALKEALRQLEKGFLIVLDDVWEEDPNKWNTLRGLMNSGGKGGAVIVTTRSDRVSEITRTLQSYRPPYLTKDESWDLFSKRAFASGAEKPEELVEIGKVIADKCGGLPLALRMLGDLLYMKRDRSEWLMIAESDTWNIETDILPALRLSYKHLPSHSKRCFTFCAIFPKDHLMEKEMLISMWMAHGFIPSDGGRLEVKGNQIFSQLVQRSFLQDVKEGNVSGGNTTCRMHDLVHDLALSITGNDYVVVQKKSSEVAVIKDAYHLFFSHVGQLDIKRMLKAPPYLRTVLSTDYSLKIINMKVSGSNFLRVLSMRDVSFQDRIFKLPSSINCLKHLRYLKPPKNLWELPESICTLLNLQTLDLSGCWQLRRLPKRMPCMISLRHLYLDRCDALEEMAPGMGRMTNLQTLTMYILGEESEGRGIGELKGLDLSSRLELRNLRSVKDAKEARGVNLHSKNLNFLSLCWAKKFSGMFGVTLGGERIRGGEINTVEQVLEELKPPRCLKVLKIIGYEGLKYPTWMATLEGLTHLSVQECRRLTSLALDGLTTLRSLRLFDCTDLMWLLPKGVVLPTLQELSVEKCPRLTSLTLDGFTALRHLDLSYCNDLMSLLPEGVVLPTLQELIVKNCPRLTSLILDGLTSLRHLDLSDCDDLMSLLPERVVLPTLQELIVKKCPRLTSLTLDGLSALRHLDLSDCDDLMSLLPEGVVLPTLQELIVKKCPRVTYLTLDGLTTLRHLNLSDCDDLISVLPEGVVLPTLQELSVEKCPRLTSLVLDGLTAFSSLKLVNCDSLMSLLSSGVVLSALQRLTAEKCPRLTSLALDGLTALSYLSLEGCTDLTSLLPEGVVVPTLQELRVEKCPRMTSLALDGLTALRYLSLEECTDLTSLLPEGVVLPTLQELRIEKCPRLTSLALGGLTALRTLRLKDFDDLTSVLPEGVVLPTLQELRVEKCIRLTSLTLDGLTALRSLILRDCVDLPFWLLTEGVMSPLLQELIIEECPRLTSLRLDGLTALRRLILQDCTALTSVSPARVVLPTLVQLVVARCPQLEKKCARGGEYWTLFSNISILKIGNVMMFN